MILRKKYYFNSSKRGLMTLCLEPKNSFKKMNIYELINMGVLLLEDLSAQVHF
jgi:hypothetical protein